MQTVYIMVGVPGAGKTTFAKRYLPHAVYLGTDSIREELYGRELTLRGRKRVRRILYDRMKETLAAGDDIVIDCTNITRRRRKMLLDKLPSGTRAVAIYLDTPLMAALQNNRRRKRHVPMIGICTMYQTLSEPSETEGFARVYKIRGDMGKAHFMETLYDDKKKRTEFQYAEKG